MVEGLIEEQINCVVDNNNAIENTSDENQEVLLPELKTNVEKQKAGRPKKQSSKQSKEYIDKVRKKNENKNKRKKPKTHKCLCCGTTKSETAYYSKKIHDTWWDLTYSGVIPYCKDCILKKYEYQVKKYGSEEKAMITLCHWCDVPYLPDLCKSLIDAEMISVGEYFRCAGLKQYANESFEKMLTSEEFKKDKISSKIPNKKKWVTKQLQYIYK